MGDPAGVGPEILLKALHNGSRLSRKNAEYLIIGDRGSPGKNCPSSDWYEVPFVSMGSIGRGPIPGKGFLLFTSPPGCRRSQVKSGRPDARWGAAILEYIRRGLSGRWKGKGPGPGHRPDQQRSHSARPTPILPGTPNFWPHLGRTRTVRHDAGREAVEGQPGDHPPPLRKAIRQIKTKRILETIELDPGDLDPGLRNKRTSHWPWPA